MFCNKTMCTMYTVFVCITDIIPCFHIDNTYKKLVFFVLCFIHHTQKYIVEIYCRNILSSSSEYILMCFLFQTPHTYFLNHLWKQQSVYAVLLTGKCSWIFFGFCIVFSSCACRI